MKENYIFDAAKAFETEGQCVSAQFDSIGPEQFAKAVSMLKDAQRIGASGCGHTGIACRHFAHLMCCIEKPARFISPAEAVHGGMGFIQKGDVMVLASRGGKTGELIPILEICKRKGAGVITVTEVPDSPLAKGADCVLQMSVTREIDRYNSQATTSFAAMSAIFDVLQAALIEETGYRSEQFALIHPGGAVGERLNGKPL